MYAEAFFRWAERLRSEEAKGVSQREWAREPLIPIAKAHAYIGHSVEAVWALLGGQKDYQD